MNFKKYLLPLAIGQALLGVYADSANAARFIPVKSDQAIDGQYIVVYKEKKLAEGLNVQSASEQLSVRTGVKILGNYQSVIKGSVVFASEKQLQLMMDDSNIDYIEQDRVVSIHPLEQAESPIMEITQNNATWGIDRIDQRNLPLDTKYNPSEDGSGVTAFIIDTGVRISHKEFGGRARHGWDFIDNDNDSSDCNGHGTHVAGTVAGKTYGVAKNAKVVGVRVLGCNGSGSMSGVIRGVDWVANNSNGPSVANMSLGGGISTSLDSAVNRAVAKGVSFIVAAGNANSNACNFSPARARDAITVGSTTRQDSRSGFSNIGNCLDVFGPGSSITSAWHTSDSATNTISGTSMAAPHVAGVAALYLDENPRMNPIQVSEAITDRATKDVLANVGAGSPNLMVYTEGDTPDNQFEIVISGGDKSNNFYSLDVPGGVQTLTFRSSGGEGDVDLYVKHGIKPLPFDFDCASETDGNEETCVINNPQAGTWHILAYGYKAFRNVTLSVSY